jgi:hypothetical protein
VEAYGLASIILICVIRTVPWNPVISPLFRISAKTFAFLMLHSFHAVCKAQTRFIPTYCTLYAIYMVFQLVSTKIGSLFQGVLTKVIFG